MAFFLRFNTKESVFSNVSSLFPFLLLACPLACDFCFDQVSSFPSVSHAPSVSMVPTKQPSSEPSRHPSREVGIVSDNGVVDHGFISLLTSYVIFYFISAVERTIKVSFNGAKP